MGNNFKEKSLKEAKEIVENLIVQTPKGKTFQFESFIQGLSEEIEDLWESGVKNGIVHFKFSEDGSLVYESLCTEAISNSPADLYFPVILKESVPSPLLSDQVEVADAMRLRDKHNQEKIRVTEELNKVSTHISEYLKENDAAKVAEETLHLDIAMKKRKLLDKLLEGK